MKCDKPDCVCLTIYRELSIAQMSVQIQPQSSAFLYICTDRYAHILFFVLSTSKKTHTYSQITMILVFHYERTFFSPHTGYW